MKPRGNIKRYFTVRPSRQQILPLRALRKLRSRQRRIGRRKRPSAWRFITTLFPNHTKHSQSLIHHHSSMINPSKVNTPQVAEHSFGLHHELRINDPSFLSIVVYDRVLQHIRGKEFRYYDEVNSLASSSDDQWALLEKFETLGTLSMMQHSYSVITGEEYFLVVTLDTSEEKHLSKSVRVGIYATTKDALFQTKASVENILSYTAPNIVCEVEWYYNSSGIEWESLNEELDETVYAEAYPFIPDLNDFVERYIRSNAAILLLIGPPGTGKTRFIKHILRKMAELAGSQTVAAMYTSDQDVLESDVMYINFVKSSTQALVLEDLDFNLRKRMDGNPVMLKLLTASDSFISSKHKKIILTTNLPSVLNTDEALLRPGRCFEVVQTRALTLSEVQAFLHASGNSAHEQAFGAKSAWTLAEVYQQLALLQKSA